MIDLSQETEALARRLADAQRTSIDAAVKRALEAHAHAVGIGPEPRPPRDRSPEAVARRRARIEQAIDEIASMPILNRRSPREITDALNDV